jgi:hypothetical protein
VKSLVLAARILLGALTLFALAASVFAFVPPAEEETRTREETPPPRLSEAAYDGTVGITIEDLDLRARTMTMSMYIDLNEQWAEVRDNLTLDVVLQGLAADDVASGEMKFWPEGGSRSLSLTIPMRVNDTELYPLDDHGISVNVRATAPAGVPLPPLTGPARDGRDLKLAITSWRLGDSMREWTVSQSALSGTNLSNTEPGSTVANIDDAYTVFFLERSTGNVVFIITIAATPFLLVLGYLLARFSTGRIGDTQTSPLELSAALLAIITLRQVLIPAEISGFTLLDKALGFEVVVLVAITVFAHVIIRPRAASAGSVPPAI